MHKGMTLILGGAAQAHHVSPAVRPPAESAEEALPVVLPTAPTLATLSAEFRAPNLLQCGRRAD